MVLTIKEGNNVRNLSNLWQRRCLALQRRSCLKEIIKHTMMDGQYACDIFKLNMFMFILCRTG